MEDEPRIITSKDVASNMVKISYLEKSPGEIHTYVIFSAACFGGSEIFKSGESDPVGPRAFESRFRAAGCLCVSVVNQRYDPEVQCPGGFLGNNVLMRCNVPSFVRDHVTITSWLQEPSFNIYPSTMGGE